MNDKASLKSDHVEAVSRIWLAEDTFNFDRVKDTLKDGLIGKTNI